MKSFFRKQRIKWSRFEYWPWWLFYIPLLPLYLYYALRSRTFTYFAAVNPGIEYGGFFGEKKEEIMRHIPKQFMPKAKLFLFTEAFEPTEILAWVRQHQLDYPIICKPNVGERGDEVVKLKSEADLQKHLESVNYDIIIQEYIDHPIELGVLYYRLPNQDQGKVASIVVKKFLSVHGDGASSVTQLLQESDRGYLQLERLLKEKPALMTEIVPKGETYLVEPIGNHCLGTEFLSGNTHLGEELDAVFDLISKPFEGLYYGRYDLKVKSMAHLKKGEEIKIFELNGVSSEPGHIYDKDYNFLKANKDVRRLWGIQFDIARQNISKGVKTPTIGEIIKRSYTHFFVSKR